MRRRIPPAAWAFTAALAVLIVGGLMPLGTVCRFGAWEIVGRRAPLWEGISRLPEARREARNDREFWDCEDRNVTNAGIVLLIAGAVGALVYGFACRRTRPIEAPDYREAPDGAVPDGRLGTPDPPGGP
jgi:hypothetical protein